MRCSGLADVENDDLTVVKYDVPVLFIVFSIHW